MRRPGTAWRWELSRNRQRMREPSWKSSFRQTEDRSHSAPGQSSPGAWTRTKAGMPSAGVPLEHRLARKAEDAGIRVEDAP